MRPPSKKLLNAQCNFCVVMFHQEHSQFMQSPPWVERVRIAWRGFSGTCIALPRWDTWPPRIILPWNFLCLMKAVIDKEDDQSKLCKSNFVVNSFWDSHLEESNSFSLALDPSFSSPSSLWNYTFTFASSLCPYSEEEMDWCCIFTFQSGLARSVLHPNPTWKRSHWTRPLQGWDGLGNDLNICSRGFDLACGINEIKI